ncbi:hypothetical protein J6590_069013 [Homalodisca vitripennis]|nr:hypothetical protein J6590_069013 [Homalodisca vitripennis]
MSTVIRSRAGSRREGDQCWSIDDSCCTRSDCSRELRLAHRITVLHTPIQETNPTHISRQYPKVSELSVLNGQKMLTDCNQETLVLTRPPGTKEFPLERFVEDRQLLDRSFLKPLNTILRKKQRSGWLFIQEELLVESNRERLQERYKA